MTNTSHRAELVKLLRCPRTGSALRDEGDALLSEAGGHRYPWDPEGVPLLAEGISNPEAEVQAKHYDRIADEYLRNLDAPFTTTYSDYLSGALLKTVGAAPLGNTAEICCGRGEAFSLLKDRVSLGVGVDISLNMLHAARRACREPMLLFVQGDATQLPLASESFDTVLFIGGIHHVNARTQLYTEVARILRPGGRALWQEPVDDFLPWRLLRRAVYQASSFLDAETEHPLRRVQTEAQLRQAGLTLQSWQTYGFLGYCLLMNSDVLVFNRALRFVPGIKGLVKLAAEIDDRTTRWGPLANAGLIGVGEAVKPA